MPRIFISYRRSDSQYVSSMIYEKLAGRFGDDNVFIDVDNIPIGVDFRRHLDDAVGRCDVLLVIIGDNWLDVEGERGRRLDDPADFVRIEIAAALNRDIAVVPVLVGSALMPTEADLPDNLKQLAYRNAAELRAGKDLRQHIDRLIRGIEALQAASAPPPTKPVEATTRSGSKPPAVAEEATGPRQADAADSVESDGASDNGGRRRTDRRSGDRRRGDRRAAPRRESDEVAPPPSPASASRSRVSRDAIAIGLVIFGVVFGLGYTFVDEYVFGSQYKGGPLVVLAALIGIASAAVTRHTLLAPLSCIAAVTGAIVMYEMLNTWDWDDVAMGVLLGAVASLPALVVAAGLRWRRRVRLRSGRIDTDVDTPVLPEPAQRVFDYVFDPVPPRRTGAALALLVIAVVGAIFGTFPLVDDDLFNVPAMLGAITLSIISAVFTRHVALATLTASLSCAASLVLWVALDDPYLDAGELAAIILAVVAVGVPAFVAALVRQRRAKRNPPTRPITEPRARWVLLTMTGLLIGGVAFVVILRGVYIDAKVAAARAELNLLYEALRAYETDHDRLPPNTSYETIKHYVDPMYVSSHYYLLSHYEQMRSWQSSRASPPPPLRVIRLRELEALSPPPLLAWDYIANGDCTVLLMSDGSTRVVSYLHDSTYITAATEAIKNNFAVSVSDGVPEYR